MESAAEGTGETGDVTEVNDEARQYAKDERGNACYAERNSK
jgi:hypothetical protein